MSIPWLTRCARTLASPSSWPRSDSTREFLGLAKELSREVASLLKTLSLKDCVQNERESTSVSHAVACKIHASCLGHLSLAATKEITAAPTVYPAGAPPAPAGYLIRATAPYKD